MSAITIRETDTSGHPTATYLITSTPTATGSLDENTATRVDVLAPEFGTTPTASTSTIPTNLLSRLLNPFLPVGYPHSVTPDYKPYQLYDSLQAFASTIASLLASRAVLQGIGLGSEDTSTSATTATLLSIAQESIGRFATIFFAHRFALQIEAEVKFYRILADIVNDFAFVLDTLSPSLPAYARIPALCTSSACRAICGVCGGSSKAILSAHFARMGNIGELNAKDGSQETVVSLVGMWVGGVIVSRVQGTAETWMWLLVLLGTHLWANWMAVKSVRLTSLNRGRASQVLGGVIEGRVVPGVEEVGKLERVFGRGDVLRSTTGEPLGSCHIGGDVRQLLSRMQAHFNKLTGSATLSASFERLLEVFEEEQYLLWIDVSTKQVMIMLKQNATSLTQLKAWCHALRLVRSDPIACKKSEVVTLIGQMLSRTNVDWEQTCAKMGSAGWNLPGSHLEAREGRRIVIQRPDTKQ